MADVVPLRFRMSIREEAMENEADEEAEAAEACATPARSPAG